jgi:hypothetical protein
MEEFEESEELVWPDSIEWPTPPPPPSRFDSLPNEILELIMSYLPPDEVVSLGAAYKRIDKLIDSNRRLFLYKKSKEDLLEAGSTSDEMRQLIAESRHLQKKLDTKLQILRYVRDLNPTAVLRSNCWFQFHSELQQKKVEILIDLAHDIYVTLGWHSNLILVQASTPEEAAEFATALALNKYDVHLSVGSSISRQTFARFRQKTDKFFVVVCNIGAFSMTGFPLLINFKPPKDVDDHLELQSLNPYNLHCVFDTGKKESFVVARAIMDRLKPHSIISGRRWYSTPNLLLRRSAYIARSKYHQF